MQRTATTMKQLALLAAAVVTISACSFSFSAGTDSETDDSDSSAGNAAQQTTATTAADSTTTAQETTTSEATTSTTEEVTTTAAVDSAQVVVIRETAERFISSTISEQFGQPLDPTCPDIPATTPGTTFTCTASTPDGETVILLGTLNEGDDLNVVTTNVVIGEFMPELARVGAEVLAEANLGNVTIDCGTESVVLNQRQEMVCDSVNEDGSAGSVTYTIADTQTGEFEVRIN